MARKRKDDTVNDGTVIDFINAQVEAQRAKLGPDCMTTAQSVSRVIGLKLPHFVLRYLFQRDTFPLERVVVLFGLTGSNKSSFLYWLYDLFANEWGGYYLHLEIEKKDTPDLRLSLTRHNNNCGMVDFCATMDDYQKKINWWVNSLKKMCDTEASRNKGPSRTTPFIIGIDSLTAGLTGDATKTMNTNDGIATRRFSDEARSLSDWFRYAPSMIQRWPMNIVAINHDKPKPGNGPYAQTIHHTPGGYAPGYYATYRILLEKAAIVKENARGIRGNRIRLKTDKGGLGTDKVSVEANIVWGPAYGKNSAGETVVSQKTQWEWERATADTLVALANTKGSGRGAAVREILGIAKNNGRYSCKALDIPPSEAVGPVEFSRRLEARQDILDELEPRLGISRSRKFVRGINYEEQISTALEAADDFLPVTPMTFYGEDTDGEEELVAAGTAAADATEKGDGEVDYSKVKIDAGEDE